MRKSFIIILGLFLVVSILFYAPVRQRVFRSNQPAAQSAQQISPLLSELALYFQQQPAGYKTVCTYLATAAVPGEDFAELYQDSLAAYSTEMNKGTESELIFYPATVLAGKNQVIQFIIRPLTDSLSLTCQTGMEVQTALFNNCRNELKTVRFQCAAREISQIKIAVHGAMLLSNPQILISVKAAKTRENQPLLIIDLSPNSATAVAWC